MLKIHSLKKFIAILLLIAFAFRPSYYVSQLAYYGLNIDYIIEKYCVNKDKPMLMCNGKCHLAERMQAISVLNTEPDEVPVRSLNVINAFIPVFCVLQQNTTKLSFFNFKLLKNFTYYKNNYSYLFSKEDLHPPTVVI